MTVSAVPEADLRAAIEAERRELAEALSSQPSRFWDAPTLCAGWRVREVVAHMTMPFRYSTAKFAAEILKSRGNFPRMADRCARRDAAASAGDLLAALRDNAGHPWKPPGGGYQGALVHDVIHGLDITVASGTGRRVPEDRLRIVLDAIARPKTVRYFGAALDGIELRADDIGWSFGSGTLLAGSAQDLALVLCGRRLPAGHLRGEPSTRFAGA